MRAQHRLAADQIDVIVQKWLYYNFAVTRPLEHLCVFKCYFIAAIFGTTSKLA